MASTPDLLSVSAAADLLGVHVDTVRRWTDEGRLAETRTPGGHRRIPRQAVDRLRQVDAGGTTLPGYPDADAPEQTWAHHAIVHTRHELGARPTGWSDALSDEGRQRSRENGQRLMGLLLQHVAGTADPDALWPEVRRLTEVYATELRDRGVPYREALRATLFFRNVLSESTAFYPHLHARPVTDQVALVRTVNEFMTEVQLAIADAFGGPDGDLPTTPGGPSFRPDTSPASDLPAPT